MSNVTLPIPIRMLMRDEPDEARSRRMWAKIEFGERRRWQRRRVAAMALGVCALAGLVLVVVTWTRADKRGPLRLADGSALAIAPVGVTKLGDGSQLTVGADSELEVVENSHGEFVLALHRGHVEFSVKPSGPRTWRIESGPLTVEVVGTLFSVDRAGGRVAVAVERGAVTVRGGGVPEGSRRLVAGQHIVVGEQNQAATVEPIEVEPTAPQAAMPDAGAAVATTVTTRRLARSVDSAPDHVLAPAHVAPRTFESAAVESAVDEPGKPPTAETVDGILHRADEAQARGDYLAAAELLTRVLREHSEDKRAGLAAVMLGRIYLRRVGDARNAALVFERALEIGDLPDALEEETYELLVSALRKAGDREGAAKAEEELRKRFPTHRSAPR